MSEFAEKVRSIGTARLAGTSRKLPVRDERDGRVGGYHVEHWSGRQDAVVKPRTVQMKVRQGEQ
jgi:hypothetical protein